MELMEWQTRLVRKRERREGEKKKKKLRDWRKLNETAKRRNGKRGEK